MRPTKELPTLRRGMNGLPVRRLQLQLIALRCLRRSELGDGMGVYGPITAAAVRRFQSHRLHWDEERCDGVADPVTRRALSQLSILPP